MECSFSIKNSKLKLAAINQIYNFIFSVTSKFHKIISDSKKFSNVNKLNTSLQKIMTNSNGSRNMNFIFSFVDLLCKSLIQIYETFDYSKVFDFSENKITNLLNQLYNFFQNLQICTNILEKVYITYQKAEMIQRVYDDRFRNVIRSKNKKDNVISDIKDKYFISKVELNDLALKKAQDSLETFEPELSSITIKLNKVINEANNSIKNLKAQISPLFANSIQIIFSSLATITEMIKERITNKYTIPSFLTNDEPDITILLMSVTKAYISNNLLSQEKDDYLVCNDEEFSGKILSIESWYEETVKENNRCLKEINSFFDIFLDLLTNLYKSNQGLLEIDSSLIQNENNFLLLRNIFETLYTCKCEFIQEFNSMIEFYKKTLLKEIIHEIQDYAKKVSIDNDLFHQKSKIVTKKINEIIVQKRKIISIENKIKLLNERLKGSESSKLSEDEVHAYSDQLRRFQEDFNKENSTLNEIKSTYANFLTEYFLHWIHCWQESKNCIRIDFIKKINEILEPCFKEFSLIFEKLSFTLSRSIQCLKESDQNSILKDLILYYANNLDIKKEEMLLFFNIENKKVNNNEDLFYNKSLCLTYKPPPINDNLLTYDFLPNNSFNEENLEILFFKPYLKSINLELSPRNVTNSKYTEAKIGKKWYERSFGIDSLKEPVKKKFACSYCGDILLHGKILLTTQSLLFYSYFNDKTLFGKHTKILIPFIDIETIEKKPNSLNINNSILVKTESTYFLFTSFYKRDKKYEFISSLLENFRELKNSNNMNSEALSGLNKEVEEQGNKIMEELKEKFPIFVDDPVYQKIHKKFYCPIWILTKNLIPFTSDCNNEMNRINKIYEIKDEKLKNFPEYFVSNDDLQIRKSPTNIIEESKKWEKIYTSGEEFQKPIKPPPIPFFPNVVSIKQQHSILVYSPTKVVIQSNTFTKGVPFCESFMTVQQIELHQYPLIPTESMKVETSLKIAFKVVILKQMPGFVKGILSKKTEKDYGKQYKKVLIPTVTKFINEDLKKSYSEFKNISPSSIEEPTLINTAQEIIKENSPKIKNKNKSKMKINLFLLIIILIISLIIGYAKIRLT